MRNAARRRGKKRRRGSGTSWKLTTATIIWTPTRTATIKNAHRKSIKAAGCSHKNRKARLLAPIIHIPIEDQLIFRPSRRTVPLKKFITLTFNFDEGPTLTLTVTFKVFVQRRESVRLPSFVKVVLMSGYFYGGGACWCSYNCCCC